MLPQGISQAHATTSEAFSLYSIRFRHSTAQIDAVLALPKLHYASVNVSLRGVLSDMLDHSAREHNDDTSDETPPTGGYDML